MRAFVLLAAAAMCASASPMTIYYTASGSGTLDGVAFGPVEFNILATASTTDVITGAGFARVPHLTAFIEIPLGPGIFEFTVPTSTIILNGSSEAIFAYNPPGTHLIGGYNDPALSAYKLDANLFVDDPSVALFQWAISDPVMTDGGRLIFEDITDVAGTFSVSIGGDGGGGNLVPEPTTWMLLGGPLALLIWRRRS